MSARISSVRLFGEIAEFRNGVNFSADSRSGSDVAFIGVGDFQGNERLRRLDQLERIARPSGLDEASLLKQGDLIFVRSNGNRALIGRCMKIEGVDGPLTHSGFTIRARLTDGSIDPEWVAQFFASGLAKRAIARQGGGTNISNLSQDMLRGIPIPVPKAAFQAKFLAVTRKFVEVTDALDDIIDAKREFKRGLAQQLLTGQKRFPKFRRKPWIEVRLGSVFTERNEINRGDLPLLSVTGDRGLIPRDELDKRDTSNPDKSKYKRVTLGDIAYNTMRMWQGVSALSSLEGIVSPAYTVVVPTARIYSGFAKHLFKFAPVVHLFHRYSQGLVDDTLNLKYDRFARIHVRIPRDVEEQEKIAATLDLCDSDLAQLAIQRENYALYKRGLLARLLSGELPVPS